MSRTVKAEDEPGEAPSLPEHKESHHDGSRAAAFICAYCAVVLLTLRVDTDSRLCRVFCAVEKCRWNIFPLFPVNVFSCWILPNLLLQM